MIILFVLFYSKLDPSDSTYLNLKILQDEERKGRSEKNRELSSLCLVQN